MHNDDEFQAKKSTKRAFLIRSWYSIGDIDEKCKILTETLRVAFFR